MLMMTTILSRQKDHISALKKRFATTWKLYSPRFLMNKKNAASFLISSTIRSFMSAGKSSQVEKDESENRPLYSVICVPTSRSGSPLLAQHIGVEMDVEKFKSFPWVGTRICPYLQCTPTKSHHHTSYGCARLSQEGGIQSIQPLVLGPQSPHS